MSAMFCKVTVCSRFHRCLARRPSVLHHLAVDAVGHGIHAMTKDQVSVANGDVGETG